MSLLQEDQLKGQNGICKFIIDNMFTHKLNYHIKKHKLLVRKIIGKMKDNWKMKDNYRNIGKNER